MKSRCGFYSKLEYCEGVVEEFGGEVGELGGEASPPLPPVDETLLVTSHGIGSLVPTSYWNTQINTILHFPRYIRRYA